jgi:hypothetical protein
MKYNFINSILIYGHSLHYFHIKNKINKLQYQCENIAINQLKCQTS